MLLVAAELGDLLRRAAQDGGGFGLVGFAAELLSQRGFGLTELGQLLVEVAREPDGAAEEVQLTHDGAADAPEGVGAEAVAEVGVEVAGGVEERGVAGGDKLEHLFAGYAHLLGGVVG